MREQYRHAIDPRQNVPGPPVKEYAGGAAPDGPDRRASPETPIAARRNRIDGGARGRYSGVMIRIDTRLTAGDLRPPLDELFALSGGKIRLLEREWDPAQGHAGVHRRGPLHHPRLDRVDAGLPVRLRAPAVRRHRRRGVPRARPRATPSSAWRRTSRHIGVHDHGFNNVSTYGNLLPADARRADRRRSRGSGASTSWRSRSRGAVQAARWTDAARRAAATSTPSTARTRCSSTRSARCGVLAVAHQLGHVLMGERDQPHLAARAAAQHAETTARYNVYYGEGRDAYDVPRPRPPTRRSSTRNDGSYRCPNTQQGYSPFTHLDARPGLGHARLSPSSSSSSTTSDRRRVRQPASAARAAVLEALCRGRHGHRATSTSSNTAADGIPYWDTGAPGSRELGD